ncbi:unnamed protein product [Amoebophrya sp. A25]|nr:unnamed protein product [Amoebophrya sp. A25]|eukprot:GSA25T00009999001.1
MNKLHYKNLSRPWLPLKSFQLHLIIRSSSFSSHTFIEQIAVFNCCIS